MLGFSAELRLVGGWRPGGGNKEEGGMIISGMKRVSGGRRVSWVVVLKRPPELRLLLADRRPGRRALELLMDSWPARAPVRRHLVSGRSGGSHGMGELDRRPLPHPPHRAILSYCHSTADNSVL